MFSIASMLRWSRCHRCCECGTDVAVEQWCDGESQSRVCRACAIRLDYDFFLIGLAGWTGRL